MKRYSAFSRIFLWILAVSLLAGCAPAATFVGEMSQDSGCFLLTYSVLNQTQSGKLSLQSGDSLIVEIAQTAGTVDLSISMDGAEAIYQGAELSNSNFTLDISQDGTYLITVTGHNAAGSVCISLQPEATEETAPYDRAAALEAYRFALQQISFEHMYPDGTDTGFDGDVGFIEDNNFALFDVNGDGLEELIVKFVTAPMDQNAETVYAYDADTGTVKQLLSVYPQVTYYPGGIVKELWFHGSGLAGEDYWPYTLYRYNSESGIYECIAEVNMWSRDVDVVNYKGDPYPDDIDAEGAGTVFIVTQGDQTTTVSMSAYTAWLEELLGSAEPMTIPYQALTEDHIRSFPAPA